MTAIKPKTIDEYISAFPRETQVLLEEIRATIKKVSSNAVETISYGIPTFNLSGHYLVYFAGYKHHISLYPVPGNNPEFEKAFGPYKTSGKGTIQFPLDKPLPINLITKIVKYLLKQNLQKASNQL